MLCIFGVDKKYQCYVSECPNSWAPLSKIFAARMQNSWSIRRIMPISIVAMQEVGL